MLGVLESCVNGRRSKGIERDWGYVLAVANKFGMCALLHPNSISISLLGLLNIFLISLEEFEVCIRPTSFWVHSLVTRPNLATGLIIFWSLGCAVRCL